MITNDATLLKVKHEVLYEVAKLAYEGRLDDERDNLPYKMVPGPQPFFRCCIYREREVIRQRIRLAEGKAPGTEDDGNVVQIINSACEGCPISRYVVTDNCQKCMGRACQQACRFGAISMGRDKSYIDPSKCKECGQCAKACPYNAIADLMRPCIKSCPVGAISVAENGTGIAVIDKDKCIDCGSCIHKCPFGAIGSKSYIVDIINDMRAGKKVFAMFAPATYGQFGADITMAWPDAQIGAMDGKLAAKIMYDGQGADVINEKAAEYEALTLNVTSAAKRGYVDQIVNAADTRKYVIGAFEMLFTKSEDRPAKKHGTV